MDILKNTEAMGKRIFADLEKINFIRTSTSSGPGSGGSGRPRK